jgi:hypothetical protein
MPRLLECHAMIAGDRRGDMIPDAGNSDALGIPPAVEPVGHAKRICRRLHRIGTINI